MIDPSRRMLFSLFLATALSISAIPLVAKILMDLNLLRTGVGQTILGSAIVNDLAGWLLFAVILSILTSRAQASVYSITFLTVAFAAACLTVGRRLTARLFDFFRRLRLHPEAILGVAVLVAFLCAAFTQWIGIHAIFGAVLAGVMIGETVFVALVCTAIGTSILSGSLIQRALAGNRLEKPSPRTEISS